MPHDLWQAVWDVLCYRPPGPWERVFWAFFGFSQGYLLAWLQPRFADWSVPRVSAWLRKPRPPGAWLVPRLRAHLERPETSKECAWCQDSQHPPVYPHETPAKKEWVCLRCLGERAP